MRGSVRFYMATVSETGWPYLQFCGGPNGLLRLDERTLGVADFRGNWQYITVGNWRTNDRVALLLMDYPGRTRLKILGRVEVKEASEDSSLLHQLAVPEYKATAERASGVTHALQARRGMYRRLWVNRAESDECRA